MHALKVLSVFALTLAFAVPAQAYEAYFEHQTRSTTMIGAVQGSVLGEATSPLEDDYGTGTNVSEGIYCPALTMTLQRGARDARTNGQVTELQLFLADYFGIAEEDLVTGFFGRLTHSYVVQFQQQKGLPALGIVGSLTRAAIARACGQTETSTTRVVPTTVTPSTPGTSPNSSNSSSNYNLGTIPVRAIVANISEVGTKFGQSKLSEVDQALQRLNAFVKQSSYDKAQLRWSTSGVYELGSGVCSHASYGDKVSDLVQRALQAADRESPIADYSLYLIVHPAPNCPDGVQWSFEGNGQFTPYVLNGRTVHLRGIHISDLSDQYLFHEFGHTLAYQPNTAIGHPDYMNCPVASSGGVTTIPISTSCPRVFDFYNGILPAFTLMAKLSTLSDYSAVEKETAGWLSSSDIVTTTSGQYTLSPLEQVGASPKALKIPVAGTSYSVYVSFRLPTSSSKPSGVVLDISNGSAASFLVTNNANLDAPLQVGVPYRIGSNGPYVQVTSITGNRASISVSATSAPTITSPSATSTLSALIVSTDVSSPGYRIVAAGSANTTVGAYKFTARNESITLRSVGVKLTSGVTGDITKVALYDGATKVGEGFFVGAGTQAVITFPNPVVIPQGSGKVLTVNADIANIGMAQPVSVSGHFLQIDFYKGAGVGNTTGLPVYTTDVTSVAGVRIMKTFPIVGIDTLPAGNLADGRLMRFKVAADSWGAVGLTQMTFKISHSGLSAGGNVSNVSVYGFQDSNYSQPITGVSSDGNLQMTNDCVAGCSASDIITVNPSTSSGALTAIQIPAGQVRYFEVRGSVSGAGTASSVTTTLLGDSGYTGMVSVTSLVGKDVQFVWSPNTVSTATRDTQDWTSGYAVPGLPASGLTFTRTGGGTVVDSSIKVTAPNGGERWHLGETNTITWTPYSYNPDVNPSGQVTAELLKKTTYCPPNAKCAPYSVVGKIMDLGKASLHTQFNINNYDTWATPGEYFVRVTNTVTGASDISDASFTLLPRAVDVKVNGSDGPVTLSDNQAITVSWKTANSTFVSCNLEGVRKTPGSNVPVVITGLATQGTGTYYAYAPVPGSFSTVHMNCSDSNYNKTGVDYVGVLAAGTPSSGTSFVRVVDPNGGEQIPHGQQKIIKFKAQGMKSYSVALYRNDQWVRWIAKDVSVANPSIEDEFGYPWTPYLDEGETMADWFGSVYKIYVTGQKTDGTGYVDDKSDAPFSLVSASNPGATECVISATPANLPAAGGYVTISWKTANIAKPYLYHYGKGGGAQAIPASGSMSYLVGSNASSEPFVNKFQIGFGDIGAESSPICSTSVITAPGVSAPVITSFSASPSYITSFRGSTYLSWSTTNANRCALSYGATQVSVNPSGNLTLFPAETTTYSLWCVNDPGTGKDGPSVSKNVVVYVDRPIIERPGYYEP